MIQQCAKTVWTGFYFFNDRLELEKIVGLGVCPRILNFGIWLIVELTLERLSEHVFICNQLLTCDFYLHLAQVLKSMAYMAPVEGYGFTAL